VKALYDGHIIMHKYSSRCYAWVEMMWLLNLI